MKKTIFYQGKTQYSNTGDALINKSLVDHFRRHANVVLNDGGMPASYLQELNMQPTELSGKGGAAFIIFLIKTAFTNLFAKRQELFFLATPPGHQFGGGLKSFVKHFALVLFYMVLYVLNVKIIKIGFSIGPIDKGAALMERWKSLFIPFYYVRDPLSLALVKKIGIKKAKFFPDLAWTYVVKEQVDDRDAVFLSFRSQVVTGMDGKSYAEDLVHKIKKLVVEGLDDLRIVIGYQVKEDREFCQLLYNEIKSAREVEFHDEQITLSTANIFSSYKFMLTNRLHVALLGYQYGALPLILSDIDKHKKIKGIFEDADASSLLLDVNHVIDVLLDSVKYFNLNRENALKKLFDKEAEYECLSRQIVYEIFEHDA